MTPDGSTAQRPDTGASGPGLATAPALSDGDAPIAVLTYRLGQADMAAWLARSRPGRRALRTRLFTAGLVGLMGLQWLSSQAASATTGAARPLWWMALLPLVLGLPVLLSLYGLQRSHLAQARTELPASQEVTLTRWPDRIEEIRSGKVVTIRPQRLQHLTVTRRHILGETETARLILPISAFADRAAMRDFARWLSAGRRS